MAIRLVVDSGSDLGLERQIKWESHWFPCMSPLGRSIL